MENSYATCVDEVSVQPVLSGLKVFFLQAFLCFARGIGGVFWPTVLPSQKVWLTDGALFIERGGGLRAGTYNSAAPPDLTHSTAAFPLAPSLKIHFASSWIAVRIPSKGICLYSV